VIHALGGEQDVRKMGGLKKHLPRTHLHGLVGALSLAGFPLFAGFWSKDAILAATLSYPFGGVGFYLAGLFVAFLTAAYAMRWYALVFLGEFRGQGHPHEAPPVMTVPNDVLALGAVFAGFLALPKPLWNLIEPFLAPALAHLEAHEPAPLVEWGLLLLSAAVALVGLYLGYLFFRDYFKKKVPAWYRAFEQAALEGFYADWLYNTFLVNPAKELAFGLGLADRGLDRAYVYAGGGVGLLGRILAGLQNGYLRFYAALILAFAALFVLWGVVR
ncbi:MAG TPA: NADH-quinone oxidoreductase subunit L, partial [Oceanithermus sp.]|nr:NADH-quinone oxidoreductase subunit L [Oceanithermus sp.]